MKGKEKRGDHSSWESREMRARDAGLGQTGQTLEQAVPREVMAGLLASATRVVRFYGLICVVKPPAPFLFVPLNQVALVFVENMECDLYLSELSAEASCLLIPELCSC